MGARAIGDDEWAKHEKLGDTPRVGASCDGARRRCRPHCAEHNDVTSGIFARAKGYARALTAAELDMMQSPATAPG